MKSETYLELHEVPHELLIVSNGRVLHIPHNELIRLVLRLIVVFEEGRPFLLYDEAPFARILGEYFLPGLVDLHGPIKPGSIGDPDQRRLDTRDDELHLLLSENSFVHQMGQVELVDV